MLNIERMDIASKLRQVEKKINDDIAQKFKNKWCLEGDENTTLFHRNINKKKHVKSVKGIEIDGIWETNPDKVKKHFKDVFSKCFMNDPECNWSQELGSTSCLTEEDRNMLEKDFDEPELKKAVWSCGYNKSPGPDGFTIEFFKKHRDLVKGDLLEAFIEFSRRPKIPKEVNATFITIIPKVQNPVSIK